MPDIGIVWNPALGRGDWARGDQVPDGADDGTGGDLTAAVLVSLFTDRRASDDFVLTDGTDNRRGCWTDSFEDEPIGSRLWQLERSKRTQAVLLAARDACTQALAWLLRDQVATGVDVKTFWAGRWTLGILVTITQAKGPGAVIDASLPWGAV